LHQGFERFLEFLLVVVDDKVNVIVCNESNIGGNVKDEMDIWIKIICELNGIEKVKLHSDKISQHWKRRVTNSL
jgi:hypothetical protein